MSKHSSDRNLRSCHDPLSHHTDSSSCMKFFLQTIWKSLFPAIWRKIFHYQQTVSQHNYLLDTLDYSLKVFFTSLLFDKGALMKLFFRPGIPVTNMLSAARCQAPGSGSFRSKNLQHGLLFNAVSVSSLSN